MYYNNDKKQEYLALLNENTAHTLEGIFGKTKKYEEKLDKDIGYFTKKEIIDMYEDCHYKRSTVVVYNGVLKKYAHWINKESIGFDLIKGRDLDRMYGIPILPTKEIKVSKSEKHQILTYADIIEETGELKNSIDQFLLYGLFCGIKGNLYEELEYSSMEDSNSDTGLIWLARKQKDGKIERKYRKFYADETLFEYARKASESEYYYQYCNNGRVNKNKLRNDGRLIVKVMLKKGQTDKENKDTYVNKRIQVRLIRILNNSKHLKNVSPLSVYWSGFIYNIRKVALAHGLDMPTSDNVIQILNDSIYSSVLDQYGREELSYYNLRNNLGRYI